MFTPHRIHGGGVVNFTEVLKRHLSPGCKVDEFTMGRRPGRFGTLLRPLMPICDFFRLVRVLLLKRHNVYHINPSFTLRAIVRDGMFLLLLRAFRRPNILVFIHGWDEEFYRRIATSPTLRSLFGIAYRRAARVVVLASSFAKKLEALGLSAERIRIFTTMFEGGSIQMALRKRADQDVWILFMARFVASKGVYELLEAFKRISACEPTAVLIMAGDGPEYQRARTWCAAQGLEDKVRFRGYVKDAEKTQLLLDADVFVLPTSHGEGCPIALLEAMGAGLPVVVSSVGGIPDIIQDGVNGIVLDVPDSRSIFDALLRLLRDAGLRNSMARINREVAWRKYEAHYVSSCIEAEYRKLTYATNI